MSHDSRTLIGRHAAGDVRFTSDLLAARPDVLELWPVMASGDTGLITMRNPWPARRIKGVYEVLMAADVPGENVLGGGSLFAENEVVFSGQLVGVVVAESRDLARRAAIEVEIDVQSNPGLLTIDEAISVESFHGSAVRIAKGNVERALREAPRSVAGAIEFGGESDRNLEPSVAWAVVEEGGGVRVCVATTAPAAVQKAVAKVLGVSLGEVAVDCPRVGGIAEGGNAVMWASLAALAAHKTGRPVRVCPSREVEMRVGARTHPLRAEFEAGHDLEGRLRGVRVILSLNGGHAIADREAFLYPMLLQLDHAYHVPHVEYSARLCKTNLAPGRPFRGRGAAVGAAIMEEIVSRVARTCERAPEEIREVNFYRGHGESNTTPYDQEIPENELGRLWNRLLDQARFGQRRALVDQWNREHRWVRRGLAMTPVKMGLGALRAEENQAAAMVQLSEEGQARVILGDVEAGQGLHEKVRLMAAVALGIDPDAVAMAPLRSDQLGLLPPDGGAGLAVDLNGRAVREACERLMARLRPVAKRCLDEAGAAVTGEVEDIQFADGQVYFAGREAGGVAMGDVVARALQERVSLAAMGHAKAAGAYFDFETGQGAPFSEFVTGAAVAEVELDLFTGETRVLRVDVLQEAGTPLHPAIDLALVEGGFVQGLGWITSDGEAGNGTGVEWERGGIWPRIDEMPMDFRVQFWREGCREERIAKGEAAVDAPFVLALCVREAIRDAMGAALGVGGEEPVTVPLPATAEAILALLPVDASEGEGRVDTVVPQGRGGDQTDRDQGGVKASRKGDKKPKSEAKEEVGAAEG